VSSDILVLAGTAASIGILHTLLGPDHYLPFVAMGKAKGWTRAHTLALTAVCGLGHVIGSIALGLIGIAFGLGVANLGSVESARGELAGWAIIAFGLVYAVWGLRRARTGHHHVHVHAHADGVTHVHTHDHRREHAHPHPAAHEQPAARNAMVITPWVLFTIFVLGPCEPLIPLLMYPAAAHDWMAVGLVTAVFALATIATMVAMVGVALSGLSLSRRRAVSFGPLERHAHSLAGAAVAACGAAMVFLGL
jgi:sulfite exporter TauE/SafE